MTKSVSKEWKYAVKYSDPNLKSPLRNEVLAVQKCQTLKIGTSHNLFRFEALFFISVYSWVSFKKVLTENLQRSERKRKIFREKENFLWK